MRTYWKIKKKKNHKGFRNMGERINFNTKIKSLIYFQRVPITNQVGDPSIRAMLNIKTFRNT